MGSCDCNLMSSCPCQLLGFREFISQQVDLRSTSNIKGVFILCRQHKDNKLLPIYKNIKCLASYHAKPKRICLMPWGWPSSIIQFLYIKPQRGGAPHTHPRVVLYRFSTSNHNRWRLHRNDKKLYHIVSLHQTTTVVHADGVQLQLYYIISLHRTTTTDD